MRWFLQFVRVFVGVLFILSGLVKANDPLGLGYKMQEFFEVWNSDLDAASFFAKEPLIGFFHWLHGYALPLSVLMITLEILAGVALLLGWWRNAVLRLLLVLIVFFTFLTAYALWSGKFRNCGCFGDCLPIPPLASFLKDVLLLVMVLALWAGRSVIKPVASGRTLAMVIAASLVFTLGLQWYVLNYLPLADCLPYKKGNNIAQQMQLPPGARPDSFAIRFVYEQGGRQFEFPAEALPADLENYTYVSRVDKLVRKGNAEPAIKGFALTGISGTDSTAAILETPKALLLLSEQLVNNHDTWLPQFEKLVQRAQSKGIPVFAATSGALTDAQVLLAQQGIGGVPVFALDFTAIRTAARAMPTVLVLEKGTITQKVSYRQMDRLISQPQ